MKVLTRLWSLAFLGIFSCTEDVPVVMNPPATSDPKIESFMMAEIDHVFIDTIKYDCSTSRMKTTNSVMHSDNFFLYRQGIMYETSSALSVSVNIYVYDKIPRPDVFTHTLVRNYLVNRPGNVTVDIEVTKNDVVFRNQIFGTIQPAGFFDSIQKIAEDEEVALIIDPPVLASCNGYLALMPIVISYKGTLKALDTAEEISIEDMTVKLYLREI
ncbi:MAG TPA: hypothetical protein VI603_07620 [Saprospiraceae bacterium]|nr:hypothetical protein [Saprospiraceae bacterium]